MKRRVGRLAIGGSKGFGGVREKGFWVLWEGKLMRMKPWVSVS
jgi:hypothetical protein